MCASLRHSATSRCSMRASFSPAWERQRSYNTCKTVPTDWDPAQHVEATRLHCTAGAQHPCPGQHNQRGRWREALHSQHSPWSGQQIKMQLCNIHNLQYLPSGRRQRLLPQLLSHARSSTKGARTESSAQAQPSHLPPQHVGKHAEEPDIHCGVQPGNSRPGVKIRVVTRNCSACCWWSRLWLMSSLCDKLPFYQTAEIVWGKVRYWSDQIFTVQGIVQEYPGMSVWSTRYCDNTARQLFSKAVQNQSAFEKLDLFSSCHTQGTLRSQLWLNWMRCWHSSRPL